MITFWRTNGGNEKFNAEWTYIATERDNMIHRGDGPAVINHYVIRGETIKRPHHIIYGSIIYNESQARMCGMLSWGEFNKRLEGSNGELKF